MKSTSQLQKKTTTKPHKTQTETKSPNSAACYSLAIRSFTDGDRRPLIEQEIDISPEDYAALKNNSEVVSCEFLEAGLKGMLNMADADHMVSRVQARAGKGRAVPEPGIEDGTFAISEDFSLLIFERGLDKMVAGADITREQMRDILHKTDRRGCSIGALLEDSVRKLATPDARAADKLNNVLYQVKALFIMLNDALAKKESAYNDGIVCGILELIWTTENRLKDVIEAATGLKLES